MMGKSYGVWSRRGNVGKKRLRKYGRIYGVG